MALVLAALWPVLLFAQKPAATATATNPAARILTVEGTNVWIQRFRDNAREAAYPNQILQTKDRGFTGARSRASVRLSDLSVARIRENSIFEIEPLPDPKVQAEFSLLKGLLYLLHRDKPGVHRFRTPTATAATRGTEFTLEVEEASGRTILTVLEGEAELANPIGSVRLVSGEQGVAVAGQMPTKTAVIDTTNVVQWCLYYPGVLDLSDVQLSPDEQAALESSLNAYRSGDLLRAVASYPAGRTPASESEKVYLGALLLAVGEVAQTEALLDSLPNAIASPSRTAHLADALRLVIAAVQQEAPPNSMFRPLDSSALPTEWLARSYAEQSGSRLDAALHSAEQAVKLSPQFAFGWARVAELEFSQGRIKPAFDALEKSLNLAPRNAQAIALKGFLLSAQNRIGRAIEFFEQAMSIDGGLGNAWLGRGLCRIRKGHAAEGRFDLQVAATTEPRRSLLRSYLGKAFSNAGDTPHAEKELHLAQEIDSGDPTPWLYSALLLQQQNRINEGVQDLEHSRELNDNRGLYRSRLLLDQDQAVSGANLANLYRDAGMIDVSVREAGRAVSADYANYSAHLFLANSFNELRDPNRVNLRYETAWFSEYLMANLLAPIGAGTLSQSVSQQEYSKLFERDRLGITSSTEYRDNGDWRQSLVQHGTVGNIGYAAEAHYSSQNGTRPNNEFWELNTILSLKGQITAQDSVFVRGSFYQNESGDLNQYYNQSVANPGLELEQPGDFSLLAGYHHEWSPGNHTLLLAGGVQSVYEVENPLQVSRFLFQPSGTLVGFYPLIYDQDYRNELDMYTTELQQILQRGDHTFVAGGRFQAGEFHTRNEQGTDSPGRYYDGTNFTDIPFAIDQRITSNFDRESVYLYDQWQFWPSLLLVGGVSYDRVHYPANNRYAPIADGSETRDELSPKVGVIFTPFQATTIRGAYYRGLGGADLDQSVRLEPSQVAGFNQAYRSLIPESVGGASAAPTFDTWALSLEQRIARKTFVGISGELLSSDVDRSVGAVQFEVPFGPGTPFTTRQLRQELDFRERILNVTFNQLLSDEWSLGARYRLSNAELESRYPQIGAGVPQAPGFEADQDNEATLHQVNLFVLFNHPSGFFSSANSIWTRQSNHGYSPDIPGDDFWQFNVEAGWRFFRRRVEARVALLNITDQDYELNPLNLTAELPRERTLALSLRFNF